MAEPQYLMFQIFTASPSFGTAVAGIRTITSLPPEGYIDAQARKILQFVGTRGDEKRKLGIMVGPISFDHTNAQINSIIKQTFDLALKYDIAVGIHIDDHKFWNNRKDLLNVAENKETINWTGTVSTGADLPWGEDWKLAPQMCFNSKGNMAAVKALAGTVIGPQLYNNMNRLIASGKQDLFAGVIVGWETQIMKDHDTGKYCGYRALTNLGFSNTRKPENKDPILQDVIRNWIGYWAKALVDAGIPADKIYSHIAFNTQFNYTAQGITNVSYSEWVFQTPVRVAFAPYCRPGFSTYPDVYRYSEIYTELGNQGTPKWASCEGANVYMEGGPPQVAMEGMESYLAKMFNHGATLVTLFGWDIGEADNVFRVSIEDSEALKAYRKFLGLTLEEVPLSSSYQNNPDY